jgi:5'-3' exonuclease
VLARFGHLEAIPENPRDWHVNAANSASLAATLIRERERALLFRNLATLRTDIALFDSVDELKWNGPRPEFEAIGKRLDKAVTSP